MAATGSSGLPKPAIDLDAKPKRGQSKPTTDVDSQQKDENETSVELKKTGSTGPSDATVLQRLPLHTKLDCLSVREGGVSRPREGT